MTGPRPFSNLSACDQLRTSFEPDSVMEFDFECLIVFDILIRRSPLIACIPSNWRRRFSRPFISDRLRNITLNERHGTLENTVIIAGSSVADRRTFTSLSVPIVKRVPSSLATIASRHDNILLPPYDIISAVNDCRLIWRRRTDHFRPSPLVASFYRRSRCIARLITLSLSFMESVITTV